MSFYNTNDDKVTLTIKIDKIMKKVKISKKKIMACFSQLRRIVVEVFVFFY